VSKPSKNNHPKASKVYLVGGGIASLASATYLIKDAGVPGENIHILEQDDIVGGALDGSGEKEDGFIAAILNVVRYSPRRTRRARRHFCIHLILRGLRELRGKSLLRC
jgi:glycine/D-amino acid oxidase-like deaminating enzyme